MQKHKDGHTFGLHITRSIQPKRVYLQLPAFIVNIILYLQHDSGGQIKENIKLFGCQQPTIKTAIEKSTKFFAGGDVLP